MSQSQPEIPLKTRWLAALLAFLLPGAGHLYQGRYFKAVLYSVCILGTFAWGMALGEWRVVHFRWDPIDRTYGYLCQVAVGLPALPAWFQSRRYVPPPLDERGMRRPNTRLEEPLDADFEGVWLEENPHFDEPEGHEPAKTTIRGRVRLQQVSAPGRILHDVEGSFVGTTEDGEPIELKLIDLVDLEPRVYANPRRRLVCYTYVERNGERIINGRIEGTIPRAFWDWFQVPLAEEHAQDLHGRLGRYYELALVFTWIAGLLNVLAIWDALEGPAYGYGLIRAEPPVESDSQAVDSKSADSKTSDVPAESPKEPDSKPSLATAGKGDEAG